MKTFSLLSLASALVYFFVVFVSATSDEFHMRIHAPSDTHEVRLREKLFMNSNYHPHIRPVNNHSKRVDIDVDIAIHHIIDLNEKYQYLEAQLWFRLFWWDDFLRWNPAEYGNLEHIQAHSKDVWTPDIEMYNEMGLEGKDDRWRFPITVDYTGRMAWLFNKVTQSGCPVNIKYFPYDHQTCPIELGSWTMDDRFATVRSIRKKGDDEHYRGNGEWEVTGIPASNSINLYSPDKWPYHKVTFAVQLTRRSNYYIFHMVFPCILISFVNSFSFLLPVSSGERMSLSVTTLLGLVVFLLVIAELMPPQSEVIPILDVYFGMCISVVSLSVILNILIIFLHFRGSRGSRMSGRMKRWVYKLGRILRYKVLMKDVGFQPDEETIYQHNLNVIDDMFPEELSARSLLNTEKDLRHHQSGRKPSDWEDCMNSDISVAKQARFDFFPQNRRKISNTRSINDLDPISGVQTEMKQPRYSKSASTEWKVMAMVLDRLFFILTFGSISTLMIFVLSYRVN